MTFKKYRNRETGEIVEARLREDGAVFEIKNKNCPIQRFFGFIAIVMAENFNEYYEKIKNDE